MKRIDTFPLTNTSMFSEGHHESYSNDQLDDKNNKGYMNGLSNNMFKESYFENEQQHAFDLNENLLSEDSFMNNANKTSIVFSGYAAGATNLSYVSSHDLEHSDFQGLKFAFDGLNYFGHFATDRMSSGFADEQQKLTHSTPSKNSSNKVGTFLLSFCFFLTCLFNFSSNLLLIIYVH